MAGIANESPLLDADFIILRPFDLPVGKNGTFDEQDSIESLLELCLSSLESPRLAATAAAKSSLKDKANCHQNIFSIGIF